MRWFYHGSIMSNVMLESAEHLLNFLNACYRSYYERFIHASLHVFSYILFWPKSDVQIT